MLKKIRHLYIYGCFHIAITTALLALFGGIMSRIPIPNAFISFVFCSTLVIYNGHRLISKNKLTHSDLVGRFKIIAQIEHSVLIILLISLIGSVVSFIKLEHSVQIAIIPLAIVTLLYILPVLGKGKRLRDIPFIKIFLIAMVYSMLCFYIPLSQYSLQENSTHLIWSCVGCFLFIFAITLPFDIRDIKIDQDQKLPSIINRMGYQFGVWLGIVLMAIAFGISIYLWHSGLYAAKVFYALTASYVISAILIIGSKPTKPDAYFSFWLDGTMALPYLFYYVFNLC